MSLEKNAVTDTDDFSCPYNFIKDGVKFDSDNAIELGYTTGNANPTDFRWYEESLYYHPNSEKFVLSGNGNAKSPYSSKTFDGMSGPGSSAQVVSEDKARQWLENNGFNDVLECLFEIEVA